VRILHLAYEDPLQPGSGGGSVRVREINRRLAERHEITNLVAAYAGAHPRVEDGTRWVPIGVRARKKIAQLSYFALLGREIVRRPHDLLVEEFGAPFSTAFSPLFTNKPVVASVQWLFASQMREKYRLPFDRVEGSGLRLYHRFVAVSGWLANELRARRPGAVVETIPNGVEEIAYEARPTDPEHLLFVGRLDLLPKGLDLLFEAYNRMRRALGERVPPLVIVGDGPDRPAAERLARQSGISRLVEFRGRVEGAEKYRLVSAAHAVLMPTRFETFGLVAIESLAVGTPLVAFDVGPLREVTGGAAGARLVPPGDVDAFAREALRFVENRSLRERARLSGRCWARGYDWDEISLRQEEFYLRTLRNWQDPERRAISGRTAVLAARAVEQRERTRWPR
jgi:glycosyltransferase involved in cell wall biosynthesis